MRPHRPDTGHGPAPGQASRTSLQFGHLPLLQGSSRHVAALLRGRSDLRHLSMPCATPHSAATPPQTRPSGP
ncbi:hypothetical protein NDU88_006006 [Pleurodeles waltl]|uniref:Uncharacterized protein n=1 Tax=Pleurodeles waltl TaxID=8319 RepID=A0AAV7TVJ6_PLEWA|nr:hypothetical protein NDU88_006006 [Pleurodeles waltl]